MKQARVPIAMEKKQKKKKKGKLPGIERIHRRHEIGGAAGPKRRKSVSGEAEGSGLAGKIPREDAAGNAGKKRRRDYGKGNILQDKYVAEGVGIDAGFKMYKPQRNKTTDEVDVAPVPELAPASPLKPVSFLDKMRARLSGGRFRMLNETLYTCRGEDAYDLFTKDPAAFSLQGGRLLAISSLQLHEAMEYTAYHTGYQEQMARWPVLPVDLVISWLRSQSPKLVVADFGCGDARLAKSVKNRVFSLDLISTDPSIIACNMAQTPLDTSSVDVAVFCLSLMGTDYPSFIQEASRVLKPSGWLVIAEIKSRFDTDNGGASSQQFESALQSLGFSIVTQDVSNKMFIMFYFQKQKSCKHLRKRSMEWPQLKPCMYKRR